MIKIEGLKKRFGEFTAVDGLNFEISRNEIFALLGPNGAGKTTTINMICGLLPPSEGKITFDHLGKDRKSLIGYCPQENIFYPKLTCLEQLIFIGQIYGHSSKSIKNRAIELLGLLGLEDKTRVRACNLSGGMKRRLNICLALIHDPEILILDEPEAGLDPQTRILVRDFIKTFGKEKTIILTTHNMDEADRLADRVAIIDHGKLLLLDTPQNLKRTVGEGDILELVLEQSNEKTMNRFAENIAMLSMNVKINAESVLIKHLNIIEQLPAIKHLAENSGLIISEIKLRENTLEDVFIHLTGRTLRQ
ncbi:MAG: ABC transporter ATP-binding protein [Bacteroidales bacterium]|jgi:ABC-2 type transport system ATP-binding protein|nr:ABC transporter ATP-binding protein [Bacteroidales bacterium]